ERYRRYVPMLIGILAFGFMVWATPRSMVITLDEARAMGGTHHPLLGFLGVMSAKNTAVNMMILTTFLSFVLYRRANRVSTRSWAGTGMAIQWAALGVAAVSVIFFGVYGYFVESLIRIGYAANMITVVTIAFFALVLFIFWLGGLGEKGGAEAHGHAAPVIAGGSGREH